MAKRPSYEIRANYNTRLQSNYSAIPARQKVHVLLLLASGKSREVTIEQIDVFIGSGSEYLSFRFVLP